MSDSIRSRFVEYLSSKGLTKAQGEKAAKLTRGSLSQSSDIKPEKIIAIKKAFPEIDIMWLMTGEGEPCKQEQREQEPIEVGRAIDRLTAFVSWLKENDQVKGESSFESICGLSNKYLCNSRSSAKGTISTEIIARVYEKFPQLSLIWLCTGKGDMITEKQDAVIDYKKAYECAVMQIAALNEIIDKVNK